MTFPDVRRLTEGARWTAADRARQARDIALPPLRWFNSEPCGAHRPRLDPACNSCGIRLRRHQRVGAAWMYLAKRGLLADTVGSGKTAQVAAVLAMCAEHGEIPARRAVVVARAAAVPQWHEQLERLVPGLRVVSVTGSLTARQRTAVYLSGWEVLVISFQTLVNKRGGSDFDRIRLFDIGTLVYDDVDAMRHHKTRTSYCIKKLAETADRVYGVHGTPLQKRLPELHSFLEPLGGLEVFGTESQFRRRFVDTERVSFWTKQPCADHGRWERDCVACRSGRQVQRTVVRDAGIKDGMLEQFRSMVAPMVLRRVAADIDDVELPAIQMSQVWVDLLPAQRERYEELRRGVLRRLREDGEDVSRPDAMAAWLRGWQICSGLATLDDNPFGDVSAKHEWVADILDGDLSEEKAVVFTYFRPNVQALCRRLGELGIGHVVMWSEEQDARVRAQRMRSFREDPQCRVLVGTTTIEQSLNLQAARHLILMDSIANPARMEQIVGRVRRHGSRFSTVYVHWLLARSTHEEAIPAMLGREQGLADAVWGEQSDIFESVSPVQLMRAIATGSTG